MRNDMLCHRQEASKNGDKHLDSISGPGFPDAALFIAKDFVEDIREVAELVFREAGNDSKLEDKVLRWANAHPAVRGGFSRA